MLGNLAAHEGLASSELTCEREVAAFERMLPDMLGSKAGRFVAVSQGQVIDEDEDEFALATRVELSHRGEFVLIRQVLVGPAPQDRIESPEWDRA